MTNVTGHGGRARTIINLANHLADAYDVEIVGLVRWRGGPTYKLDSRIKLRYVVDARPFGPDGKRRSMSQGGVDEAGRPVTRQTLVARQRPSAIAPLDPVHWASSDGPLSETIERIDADILLGTTPSVEPFHRRVRRRPGSPRSARTT